MAAQLVQTIRRPNATVGVTAHVFTKKGEIRFLVTESMHRARA